MSGGERKRVRLSSEVDTCLSMLTNGAFTWKNDFSTTQGKVLTMLESSCTKTREEGVSTVLKFCLEHSDFRVISRGLTLLFCVLADSSLKVRLKAVAALKEIASLHQDTCIFVQQSQLQIFLQLLQEENVDMRSDALSVLKVARFEKAQQLLLVAKTLLCCEQSGQLEREETGELLRALRRRNQNLARLYSVDWMSQLKRFPLSRNLLSDCEFEIPSPVERPDEDDILVRLLWNRSLQSCLEKGMLVQAYAAICNVAVNSSTYLGAVTECAKLNIQTLRGVTNVEEVTKKKAQLMMPFCKLSNAMKRSIVFSLCHPNCPEPAHLQLRPVTCSVQQIKVTHPIASNFGSRLKLSFQLLNYEKTPETKLKLAVCGEAGSKQSTTLDAQLHIKGLVASANINIPLPALKGDFTVIMSLWSSDLKHSAILFQKAIS